MSVGLPPPLCTWWPVPFTVTTSVTFPVGAPGESGPLAEPSGGRVPIEACALPVTRAATTAAAPPVPASSSWSHGSSTVTLTSTPEATREASAEASIATNPSAAWQRSHVSALMLTATPVVRAVPDPGLIETTVPTKCSVLPASGGFPSKKYDELVARVTTYVRVPFADATNRG